MSIHPAFPSIYPCLWFDNNAQHAVAYYCSLFADSSMLLDSNPVVSTFVLNGTKLMALNGGATYSINPAISLYVYCGSEAEVLRLYNALSSTGNVLMPLGEYAWSKQYAWVADQFGVNWQLDVDEINASQKIVPSQLFGQNKHLAINDALAHYITIFKPSSVLLTAPYPESDDVPTGTLLFAQYKLLGFIFNAMSSNYPHAFDFTPAQSFVITCDTQEQIDYYWERLGEGGHYEMCGWLADKFGISWQIVPSILPQLIADPEKGRRVVDAFMRMKKFDIDTLLNV